LAQGDLQLAVMDIESDEIEPLRALSSGKHVGAQWPPDGSFVYFLSHRDGISNIYRMSASGGEITQVTDLQTGVNGVSNLNRRPVAGSQSSADLYMNLNAKRLNAAHEAQDADCPPTDKS
jgi:hypothetical protein